MQQSKSGSEDFSIPNVAGIYENISVMFQLSLTLSDQSGNNGMIDDPVKV